MAYGFNTTLGTGATDQVDTTYAGDTATQQTWSMWANRHGDGGNNAGRFFFKSVGTGHILFNSGTNNQYRYQSPWTSAGTWAWARTAVDTWFNIVVQYDNSSTVNVPTVWHDNSLQTLTLSTQPTGSYLGTDTNVYSIGNQSGVRVWDGMHAEFAIWNRFITADEIAAIAAGYSPLFFRESLMEYVPLVRDPVSFKNGGALTVTATAVQPHPRIIYPVSRFKGARMPPPMFVSTNWQGVFRRVA